MSNFGTLYGYELRKIVKRKIVWVSVFIMLIIILVSIGAPLIGTYYAEGNAVDTNYHMFQMNRAYQKSLDGRQIDQTLLEEMKAGYEKIPSGTKAYSFTEEYQTYARPYSVIFNFVRQTTGMTTQEMLKWKASEQDMYAKRQAMLENEWKNSFLTQEERDFWKKQEAALKWPVRFQYKEGYWQLFDCVNTIGLMTIVVVTVCLSNVFTEEHSRKTDQLILSSKYGRAVIYWAKLFAGITFCVILSLLFNAVAFGAAFVLYGSEGFFSAFQLIYADYSCPMTTGEAVLISYAMLLIVCVFTGVFVMMVSELFCSGVATLSLVVGMILLSMFFNIPEQYRILYQLWSYLPSEFAAVWNIFSLQTVPFFGKNLFAWQAVPVLYLFLGGIFGLIGKRAFTSYQVKGR